jgi:peroxiredoxin
MLDKDMRFVSGAFLFCGLAMLVWAGPVPRLAPDFAMNMEDGSKVGLKQYRGKVILMAYVLTTCPHCQRATGSFKKLQTELGPKGFQVLEAAVEDEAKDHLAAFKARFQQNFPVGWSDRPNVAPVLQPDPKKLTLMPQVVVIDRKGRIQAQFGGDDKIFEGDEVANLRTLIQKYL